MAIIEGWLPPTREHWELIVWGFQFFPLFTAIQWITDFYPQGKTSITSRFNLPGKYAWALMECPGFLTVLYLMYTLPSEPSVLSSYNIPSIDPNVPAPPPLTRLPLPVGNWTMAGIYTIHYVYRALISPFFLNISMSPIHPLTFAAAFMWQLVNGISIGGWLGGYGRTTVEDWGGMAYHIEVGLVIWGWGLLANMFHEDELREIRRQAKKRFESEDTAITDKKTDEVGKARKSKRSVDKHYEIPQNYLFDYVLYPHYLCEWIEWTGFWMVGGWECVPARNFLVNEISTMLPRALAGKRWYVEKFGAQRLGDRRAVIPWLL